MNIVNAQPASGDSHSAQFTILAKQGLHARPSARFVKLASRFKCSVLLSSNNQEVNGKSIMGLMMLAAGHGSELTVICTGSDAADALRELGDLIGRNFDEEPEK